MGSPFAFYSYPIRCPQFRGPSVSWFLPYLSQAGERSSKSLLCKKIPSPFAGLEIIISPLEKPHIAYDRHLYVQKVRLLGKESMELIMFGERIITRGLIYLACHMGGLA